MPIEQIAQRPTNVKDLADISAPMKRNFDLYAPVESTHFTTILHNSPLAGYFLLPDGVRQKLSEEYVSRAIDYAKELNNPQTLVERKKHLQTMRLVDFGNALLLDSDRFSQFLPNDFSYMDTALSFSIDSGRASAITALRELFYIKILQPKSSLDFDQLLKKVWTNDEKKYLLTYLLDVNEDNRMGNVRGNLQTLLHIRVLDPETFKSTDFENSKFYENALEVLDDPFTPVNLKFAIAGYLKGLTSDTLRFTPEGKLEFEDSGNETPYYASEPMPEVREF